MPIDPIFSFVNAVTDHLANRTQRLYALAYVRAIQLHPGAPLKQALPPRLYRPVRNFIAESEWEGRTVIWRAVAEVLPLLDITWLSCRVSSSDRGYAWAWLCAYTSDGFAVPLDVVLIGPGAMTRCADDYVAAQLEVLSTAPAELLRSAPLGITGALAERADVRRSLALRGVIYSAQVRPSSRHLGVVLHRGRRLTFRAVVERVADAGHLRCGPGAIRWGHGPLRTEPPDETVMTETVVVYYEHDRLAAAILTNEFDPERLRRRYDPAGANWPTDRRPDVPWRPPRLRGARAWEHHLALNAVLTLHDAERRHFEPPSDY